MFLLTHKKREGCPAIWLSISSDCSRGHPKGRSGVALATMVFGRGTIAHAVYGQFSHQVPKNADTLARKVKCVGYHACCFVLRVSCRVFLCVIIFHSPFSNV